MTDSWYGKNIQLPPVDLLRHSAKAVSPSSVWRVLQSGLLPWWKGKPAKKETGFEQVPAPTSAMTFYSIQSTSLFEF